MSKQIIKNNWRKKNSPISPKKSIELKYMTHLGFHMFFNFFFVNVKHKMEIWKTRHALIQFQ